MEKLIKQYTDDYRHCLKCTQAHGWKERLVSSVNLELRVKLHKHFFPINVTVLCRSGEARLCLESAIAKLSHECPTLRQSGDHAESRRETKS